MIRTKSIYDPFEEEDGLRLLVTRYWPRGVKKERSDAWLRDLGPGPALIKAWKSGALTWDEFCGLYLDEFASEEKKEALQKALALIEGRLKEGEDGGRAGQGGQDHVVTLLCTCRDGRRCHRAILKKIVETRLNKG